MTTEPKPPKVFISYSHDSQEHAAHVLRLSDALCAWGFDCHIDQYELAPEVTLSPFHIGKFQVTQAQWQAVMKTNPSNFKGDKLPVESVSWQDAFEFCLKLSEKTGKEFRLPTEAEWEYACRAGSTGMYCFGNNKDLLEQSAWHIKNIFSAFVSIFYGTHPVGEKLPNDWGLHDMHGNVLEWCADWYGSYSPDSTTDPKGASSDSIRVQRGSYYGGANICRSANRHSSEPDSRDRSYGFRLVMSSR